MADSMGTTWAAEPHTLAKHAVLSGYLEAWLPILTRQTVRVGSSLEPLYIDGFAGPGEYLGGEPGSPVIALRAAMGHVQKFPKAVRFLFIEYRNDRWQHLNMVLGKMKAEIDGSPNVHLIEPREGDCNAVLNNMLDEYERKGTRLGPALAFLDQFGYAAVSMTLVERILRFPQCEIFVYLDYKDMNRWITDPEKAAGFSRTYGGDEWRKAIDMPEKQRREYLLQTYIKALKDRGKAEYVSSFAMYDKTGRMLYWLVFCTGNLRGLEEMKKAMWSVDKTGNFRFSDRDDRDQPLLLDSFDDQWLAYHMKDGLAGREMTVAEVKEYVLTQTPCYLYKTALRHLECTEKSLRLVNPPPKRRVGTFPDESSRVVFENRGLL